MIAVSLSQFDGLAGSLAEVVQFCPAGFAASNRLNIQNVRRMQRENPLYPFVIDDPPDRESLVDSPAFAGDYRAGKDLCSRFVAFLDSAVDVNHIADLKMRNLVLQTFALNSV